MAPLIAMLMENGLNLLGQAVLTKGKEVVEDKLGIKLTPEATQADILALKQAEFQHEEWLVTAQQKMLEAELAAEAAEAVAISDRWKSDMASDSWLSKNIRPVVLLYILVSYTVLSLMSAAHWNVNEEYVKLLGEWGMLVMTAYFGSRGIEKVMSIRQGKKNESGN